MREFDFDNVLFHGEHIGAQKRTISWSQETHTHTFVELIYICNGTGIQEIGGVPYSVKHGDFLFVNYGQTHRICPDSGMTYIEVMFDLEFISQELINKNNAFDILSLSSFNDLQEDLKQNIAPIISFSEDERYTIEYILRDLLEELRIKPPLYQTIIHGYIEALLAKLLRNLTDNIPESLSAEKQDVLLKMMDYINENFSEDISLESLAERSFYNPSYFSRIFKERFGMGFKSYIIKLRTDRAAELLTSTSLSVKEIMERCGFNDKNAFYRAIEKWYGTTPSGIRSRQ